MSSPWTDRRLVLRLLLGGVALALADCGRKGAPLPPYDVDPCYPRHYPMDEGAKRLCAQKEEYAREHPPQPPPEKPEKGQKKSGTAAPAQTPAAQPPASQPQDQPAPSSPPSDSKPQ